MVSSLWTMPTKLCISPAKLEPCSGSLHLGQIRPRAGPLWGGVEIPQLFLVESYHFYTLIHSFSSPCKVLEPYGISFLEKRKHREGERERKNAINSGHYIPPATSFSVKNHYLTKPQLEEIWRLGRCNCMPIAKSYKAPDFEYSKT